ncbi:FecR family protein [Chitinophaga jiangningensis]|uniref:FecR family protein n=1 Tax=Chitinophaga jiangningensis TaxID=1419482 RepID=A0A1M6VMV7_9BACT|nr:FecR family protein [Chitinophaga jiangningensis]SHK82897.1 FecR family protein [Chitinophaga jiangningensis]
MDEPTISQRIAYLVYGYQQQTLTEAENTELMDWIQAAPGNRAYFEQWTNAELLQGKLQQYRQFDANAGWEAFRDRHYPAAPAKSRYRRLYWWSAAAAIALLVATGAYLRQDRQQPIVASVATPAPIVPGSNKATLTLADGSTIPLDSATSQVFNQQGSIAQLQNGQLQYAAQDPNAAIRYNTLTTPRGGQFRLMLPDGTKVWLNAASAITYPTSFEKNKREVTIKGEIYFEVATHQQWPFEVKTDANTSIEVLGTSFNINAYTDEAGIKTTLISGAVKVNAGTTAAVLRPGQQALVNAADKITITHADTTAILAWKREAFYFQDADIPTVMRQLARWYDVTIVYNGNIPARRFQGEIQRRLPLTDVLEGLQASGLHFRVEGRNIIVEQ